MIHSKKFWIWQIQTSQPMHCMQFQLTLSECLDSLIWWCRKEETISKYWRKIIMGSKTGCHNCKFVTFRSNLQKWQIYIYYTFVWLIKYITKFTKMATSRLLIYHFCIVDKSILLIYLDNKWGVKFNITVPWSEIGVNHRRAKLLLA